VRGQETNRSPSASFFFSKSCLCLFWPSRTATVVTFVITVRRCRALQQNELHAVDRTHTFSTTLARCTGRFRFTS
jgi:hypothetical protein